MNSKTTTVIVNWNGARFLKALIDSIQNQSDSPIIVIDNASSDNSLDLLSQYSTIEIIKNKTNVGFGSAANQGFKKASTSYVLLLNVDVVVLPDCIRLLEDFIEKHSEAAAVAPQLRFPDGSLQRSCRSFPTILKLCFYLSFLDRIIPTGYRLSPMEHEHLREVEQPMGAAILFRKSELDALGGFDEQFFLYMEDVDLCERIHRNGGRIYLYPDAKVVHQAGGSSDQDWQRAQINFMDSVILYFRKRSNKLKMLLLRGGLSIAYLMRSMLLLFVGKWQQSGSCLRLSFRVLQ